MSFNPSPQVFGGSAGSPYEVILDALIDADGTALSKVAGSIVWHENNAIARAIVDFWRANQRLANQWTPALMTDFLPRFESIYGIIPSKNATLNQRRVAIAFKLANYNKSPTRSTINDLLTGLLGPDIYLGITNITSDQAVVTGAASVPGGTTIPGGTTYPDGDFRSAVAYIAIQVQKPVGMDEITFYLTVGQVQTALDNLLPAWTTFAWYRNGSVPNEFILDDDHNLDNEFLGV